MLGVDPGTTAVGYAVVDETARGLALIEARLLAIPKQMTHSQRLLALADSLNGVISRRQPGALGIEQIFFSKNAKTALAVAEARGVILLTAARHGLIVYEYTPLEVKLAVSGYGRADKHQVKFMIERLLGIKASRLKDDVTDAIAIAITALRGK